jgi:methanogenic corrinoid protein MtbC1
MVSIGQEHFTTQFIRRKLQSLLNVYDIAAGQATIVAACMPGEFHDVGLMILALMLVRRGYRVVFLGPDVPIQGILPVVEQVSADLVCLSATTAGTAVHVQEMARALHGLPHPPLIVAGGRGVESLPADDAPYIKLTGDALAAAMEIRALLHRPTTTTRGRGA